MIKKIIEEVVKECLNNLPKINKYKTVEKTEHFGGGTLAEVKAEFEEVAEKYGVNIESLEIYNDYDYLNICIPIEVDRTEKEIEQELIKRFQRKMWNKIYKELINVGYKRAGFNSGLLKEFDNTSVYQMAKDGDFDRLTKYYSLYFKK